MTARIFVVDDLEASRDMVRRILPKQRFAVETFATVEACLAALVDGDPDAIVTDVRMPGIDGIEGLARFRAVAPDVPVVIMTAYASIENAIEAMKRGAFDYLKKPFEPADLEVALERAVRHRTLLRENRDLRTRVTDLVGRTLIARSGAMREVVDLLAKVAPTDATVVIQGESGTGKEVVAREIHARSRRADHRFLAINCSAIPENLLESELFGYERGAFSGAAAAKKGFFAEAAGGTLLLDEIGEMPMAMQPKLLRVLQDGEYYPIGGREPRHADVRLICATNRDLEQAVREGKFREDLLYRVRVVTLRLPPLRARVEDIELLARHFVRKHATRLGLPPSTDITPGCVERMVAYGWPGNVRELENAMERSMLVASHGVVDEASLPPEIRAGAAAPRRVAGAAPGAPTAASPAEAEAADGLLNIPVPLDQGFQEARRIFERAYLAAVVHASGGNVARAAELCGVHRSTLYEKLTKLGIPHEA